MSFKTWDQIRSKVQMELDIEVEEFIQPSEFINYVNDGVAMAEADIHKLGLEDDYFLTKATIALTVGQEDFTLPTPIYMNKIKGIIYSNGATIYEITRLRGQNIFENIARINQYNTITDYYRYIVRNDSAAAGTVLQFVPPSREELASAVTAWYIRACAKWALTDTSGTGTCDLPEIALQFLYQYVKYRCYEKEGHPNTEDSKQTLEKIHEVMMSSLEQMVADGNTELIRDLSSYQDMS
jgi:hypothetical protein